MQSSKRPSDANGAPRAQSSSSQPPDSSLSAFQDASKNYEELALIGTGAYGTVYKARDLVNQGKVVALKKIRIQMTEEGIPLNTLREITLLKQVEAFEHPNIVKLLDICHGRRLEQENLLILYLVFEHVDQDLYSFVGKCPPPGLGPEKIKDIQFQLMSGVDFLHSNRIVHRDLKPQNILIANSGQVKIADFGLARILEYERTLTNVVVTLWYRSPELLLQGSYASSIDIWSCGCIFAELFRRKALFPGESEVDQLRKIFEILGPPPEEEWPSETPLPWLSFKYAKPIPLEDAVPEICSEGKDLLQKMLIFDPRKRISAKDSLNHEYFKDMVQIPLMHVAKKPRVSKASKGSEPGTSALEK